MDLIALELAQRVDDARRPLETWQRVRLIKRTTKALVRRLGANHDSCLSYQRRCRAMPDHEIRQIAEMHGVTWR